MIPKRNSFPMPGNGAKVASAEPPPEAPEQPAAPPPSEDLIGGDPAPASVATLDTTSAVVPQPPRPKTSGRPGAPIQFSSGSVTTMIATLENCLSPKVTFSEDVNLMRAEAHRMREEGLRRVLAALKAPA